MNAVADAAVAGEAGVIEQHIVHHVASGGSMGDALIGIVAPAARRLGEDWESDARDFMDVTIGLGTLHQVLLGLTDVPTDEAMPNRRILLGCTPGENHRLGIAIIEHFFRAARWDVQHDPHADRRALVSAVSTEWFAAAGLSLSGDHFIDEAQATLREMREASANRGIRILVGGPAFERHPGLERKIGADAVAKDGRAAVAIATGWLLASAGRLR